MTKEEITAALLNVVQCVEGAQEALKRQSGPMSLTTACSFVHSAKERLEDISERLAETVERRNRFAEMVRSDDLISLEARHILDGKKTTEE